jgi:hypothetical protein
MFKACLGYMARLCLKKIVKREGGKGRKERKRKEDKIFLHFTPQ